MIHVRNRTARGAGAEGKAIASGNVSEGLSEQHGLFLLFPHGKRPDAARMADVVAGLPRTAISHRPAADAGEASGRDWLELLVDGMTFDLSGLAPGRAESPPNIAHRFDTGADPLDGRTEVVKLVAGPHLQAGANSLPVVRALTGLGAMLGGALGDLSALAWGPSQSVIGPAYFRSTVETWLAGGPFPALGLTAFRTTLDDGLQSVGLDYLIGQELRIEPVLVDDLAAATRLAIRLVNLLIGTGPLAAKDRLTAPDGSVLLLRPSPNGRFVRVYPG